MAWPRRRPSASPAATSTNLQFALVRRLGDTALGFGGLVLWVLFCRSQCIALVLQWKWPRPLADEMTL